MTKNNRKIRKFFTCVLAVAVLSNLIPVNAIYAEPNIVEENEKSVNNDKQTVEEQNSENINTELPKIDYLLSEKVNEDHTSIEVSLETFKKNGAVLQSIILPDGSEKVVSSIEDHIVKFIVTENKSLVFKIKYKSSTDSEDVKEINVEYVVNSIPNLENEKPILETKENEESRKSDEKESSIEISAVNPTTENATDSKWFTFNQDTNTIIGYSGDSGAPKDIVIPNKINGIDVKYIADNAFAGQQLTGVVFPESILTIGSNAFKNNLLTSIILPSSLQSFGAGAFETNTRLASVTIQGTTLSEIPANAFKGCNNLTSVSIPNSINKIGNRAFDMCSKLEHITFPTNLTTIGNYAFNNVPLTEINLPNTLQTIGEYGFYGTSIRELSMPDSVTKVGEYGFAKCKNLSTVKLSSNLKELPRLLFEESNLTSLDIPDGVTSIKGFVLSNSKNFGPSIIIPSSVTSIDSSAFVNLPSLKTIEIPSKSDGEILNAPWGSQGYAIWKDTIVVDNKFVFSGKNNGLVKYLGNETKVKIPDSFVGIDGAQHTVGRISNNAFSKNTTIREIELPAGLIEIGDSAFENCSSLTIINFPEKLENIGSRAFYSTSLNSLDLPDSLNSIGYNSFAYNKNLKSVTLPEKITYIPEYAFSYTGLQKVEMPGVKEIGRNAFYSTSLSIVDINDKVTSIGTEAFGGKDALGNTVTRINIPSKETGEITGAPWGANNAIVYWKDVVKNNDFVFSTKTNSIIKYIGTENAITIPANITIGDKSYPVKSVGEKAFYNMNRLTSLKIENGVEKIENEAFFGCTSISNQLIIPNSVKKIGVNAFNKTGISGSLILPATLNEVGANAFRETLNLSRIEFERGFNANIDNSNSLFYGSGITELVLADNMKSIPAYICSDCNNLEKVNLENITEIPASAFSRTNLRKLDLSMVTLIDFSAFENSSQLSDIGSFTSLSILGNRAFSGTKLSGKVDFPKIQTLGSKTLPTGVTEISIGNTVKSMKIDTFIGADTIKRIFVDLPRDSVNQGISTNQPWGAVNAQVYYRGELITFDSNVTKVSNEYKRIINIKAYVDKGNISVITLPAMGNKPSSNINVGGSTWPLNGTYYPFEVTANGIYTFSALSSSGDTPVTYTVTINDIGKPIITADSELSLSVSKLRKITEEDLLTLINASATDELGSVIDCDISDDMMDMIHNIGVGQRIAINVDAKGKFDGTAGQSATVYLTATEDKAPVITAPETITMNVGDKWDPLDPTIVQGLSVSDEEDTDITLKNVSVTIDEVPVGGKSFIFFANENTGRITTPGTYKVTYSVTDSDQHTTIKDMKVKVNGQPYMKNEVDQLITNNNMPYYYFRVGTSFDPNKDVKAYYMKASENIGDKAVETEITSANDDDGVFRVENFKEIGGSTINGSPSKAGKYSFDYYIKTPSAAESEASIKLNRILYAQGKIEFEGSGMAYSKNDPIKNYKNWNEFYDKHKDKLKLSAKLSSPDQNGEVHKIDLLNTVKVINTDGDEIDFNTIDFSLPEGDEYKEIPLLLEVTDEGKAYWDLSGNSVYGKSTKRYELVITVQKTIGAAPVIEVEDIQRVENDEIRDIIVDPNKDISTDEEMEKAVEENKTPLYDRLMHAAKFSDDKTPSDLLEKRITKITRISKSSDSTKKTSYSPESEKDIKEMMTTIGTYTITYEAIDEDKNKTIKDSTIYVSGKTHFVSQIDNDLNPNNDLPPIEVQNFLVSNKAFIPNHVLAYHIDYDENTVHQTVVTPSVKSLNISKAGTQEVNYQTEHHFSKYPDSQSERPKDIFKQKIKVNGEIEFDDLVVSQNYFVNEEIPLNKVSAFYMKASDKVGEIPVKTSLQVTNDFEKDSISFDTAGFFNLVFRADASKDSGVQNHSKELITTVLIYGLPKINAPDTIRVKEGITQQELKNLINASASIEMPDASITSLTDSISYDFTNVDDEGDPSVLLSVKYTLLGGSTHETKHTVKLERVKKPEILANDVSYNVGDIPDLIQESGLEVKYESPVDPKDVLIEHSIPMDSGRLKTAGTYKVTFKYKDTVGNVAVKEILVKVNGLPEITGVENMTKRVGDSFDVWSNIKVKWYKAPELEGPATEEIFTYQDATTKGAVLELRNMKDVHTKKDVDFTSLNEPGYYSGEYYAKTPAGGEVSEQHTLLLHGKPEITATSFTISKNETGSGDFLKKFENQLNLNASVMRAYVDKGVEQIDLTSKVEIIENNIEYGKSGVYTVKLKVTDDLTVSGSSNNSVELPITVTVVDIVNPDKLPMAETPDRHRVQGDPIGINNSGDLDISEYLVKQPKYHVHSENVIIEYKLKGLTREYAPDQSTPEELDISNDSLRTALNSVGKYVAIIEVKDTYNNIVQFKQNWYVAGKTEFVIQKDQDYVPLGDTFDIRQSTNEFTYEGIRAYHLDPDGSKHFVGVDAKHKSVDINAVKVEDLTISAPHHYNTYEDNPTLPRDEDSHDFKLLVQGRIEINAPDLSTRVGSAPDITKGVTASFMKIDKTGKTSMVYCKVIADKLDTSNIGIEKVKLTATDEETNAADNVETGTRTVFIESIPMIHHTSKSWVSKDMTNDELLKKLNVSATYLDFNGNVSSISNDHITIDLSKVNTSKPGNAYPVNIRVQYEDAGDVKYVEKEFNLYVLNEAVSITEIPKYLEMKDDGNGTVSAEAEVKLYNGNDKDAEKNMVPRINIFTDTSIKMVKGNDSFDANVYQSDGVTMYTDQTKPIISLKYGDLEKDTLILKTEKAKISKEEGLYEGTLHFTMEYEGD